MHWETYSKSIPKIAKEIAKECYHKVTSQIKAIERDLKETNNNPEISMNRDKQ